MTIHVRNVPPEGLDDLQLENRLAFRQWSDTPGGMTLPGSGGAIRHYSPFSTYGESMLSEGTPCLVCGHPTSDCTTHEPARVTARVTFGEEDEMTPRTTRVQGDLSANDDPDAALYVVPDDVVEEFYPQGSSRPSHRLVARKGETILRERAVQLGLVEGAPRSSGIPVAEIVTKEGESIGLQ